MTTVSWTARPLLRAGEVGVVPLGGELQEIFRQRRDRPDETAGVKRASDHG